MVYGLAVVGIALGAVQTTSDPGGRLLVVACAFAAALFAVLAHVTAAPYKHLGWAAAVVYLGLMLVPPLTEGNPAPQSDPAASRQTTTSSVQAATESTLARPASTTRLPTGSTLPSTTQGSAPPPGGPVERELSKNATVDLYPGVTIALTEILFSGTGAFEIALPLSNCSPAVGTGERIWIRNDPSGGPTEYLSIQLLSVDTRRATAMIRSEWPLTGSFTAEPCF